VHRFYIIFLTLFSNGDVTMVIKPTGMTLDMADDTVVCSHVFSLSRFVWIVVCFFKGGERVIDNSMVSLVSADGKNNVLHCGIRLQR